LRTEKLASDAQMNRILRNSGGKLVEAIESAKPEEFEVAWSFPEVEAGKLMEDFDAYAAAYTGLADRKGQVKLELRENAERFASMMEAKAFDPEGFVEEGCVFLDLIARGKMKARAGELELHYPQFREWLQGEFGPQMDRYARPEWILAGIARRVEERFAVVMEEEELLTYEALLEKAAELDPQQFDAVIVDEFQDTDPVQWRLFRKYIGSETPLILVGDPKQSIYGFRNADIHTYLQAREEVEEHRTLGVNYRSCPSLVRELNRVFSQEGMFDLPGKALGYEPVEAGVEEDTELARECPLLFLVAEKEELFFAKMVREIPRLGVPYGEIAILVKDRYQAARLKRFLGEHGIAARSSRGVVPAHSAALQPLQELLEAILDPGDRNRLRIAQRNRLCRGVDLPSRIDLLQQALEKGFAHCFEVLMRSGAAERLLREEGGAEFLDELYGVVGVVASHLDQPPLAVLQELNKGEEVDGSPRLFSGDPDAVQLLTIFGSKGLEYRVVFALATASVRSRDPAEEMRLYYVALTRAVERVYVCVSQTDEVPQEILVEREAPMAPPPELPQLSEPPRVDRSYRVRRLQSFTSLVTSHPSGFAAPHDFQAERTIQNLPAGAETGILVHKLLELMPGVNVAEQVVGTLYEPWTGVLEELVHTTWHRPLLDFCMADVDPKKMVAEMEFQFGVEERARFAGTDVMPGEVTGVIDLFFEHEGKIYLLDWKTNWLPDYSPERLEEAMQQHNYFLQMELYLQALGRYLHRVDPRPLKELLGGIFYVFVRGGTYFMELGT
jgi:exodeoxyribonuclease V beta subunit